MRLLCSFLFLIILAACSLESKDILLAIDEIEQSQNYYAYDASHMEKTKELRERNPKSIHAHVSYLRARRGMKAVQAEYIDLLKKNNNSPFYKYLKLRAELFATSYRDMGKRNEIIEELEKIALNQLNEEATYDIASLHSDKKKKRELAEKLYKKKPQYLPYQRLYAETLNGNDDGKEILKLCRLGLKEKTFHPELCSRLSEVNKEELLSERSELLNKILELTAKSRNKEAWSTAYGILSDIVDTKEGKERLQKLEASILKMDSSWLPHPWYRFNYGDISFDDYKLIKEMGEINKKLDFNDRIKSFEAIINDPKVSDEFKAKAHANLGFAYLNPANKNEAKAYTHLMKSYDLKNRSLYVVNSIVKLILDSDRDPQIGLDLLASIEAEAYEKNEERGAAGANNLDYLKGGIENNLTLFPTLRGRLFLKQEKPKEAKLEFLKAYHIKETEFSAFQLGKIYAKESPSIALEFLTLSLKHKSEQSPLEEELVKERSQLMTTLQEKILVSPAQRETLLSLYEDKEEEKDEEKPHPFLGKEIITQKLTDLKGEAYDWKQLKGSKVILSFWATWCTPCFQEMAVLNKIQKEGKLSNLKIIGVCTDGLSQKRKVSKILKEGNIEFDILLDDGTFRDKYLVSAIPSMFFLNEAQKFIKHKKGYSPGLEEDIFKIFQ